MKKVFLTIRWIAAALFVAALFIAPDLLASTGMILGSTFIASSVTWEGKQNMEAFLKPLFIGKSPFETAGFRIIPNAQSNMKLQYFGTASKLLKAYTKGFNAAAGTTYSQRTLTVHRMKAEAADDATDFFQTVYEQGLKKGDWNDLTGTQLKAIIAEIYRNAIASDVFRQAWLNDENKETVSSGIYTGTADTDYNVYDGIWKMIFDNSSLTPTATQIQRIAVADGAVAQVESATLTTGSSGSLILTFQGVNYTEAYVTDYDTTIDNFVTTHAAALALRKVTIANAGSNKITFTSAVPGQPIGAVTFASASDITGTQTTDTANTAPTALASGEAEDIFLGLWEGCPKVLKNTPKNEKVILCNDIVLDNYIAYLEGLGTEAANRRLVEGEDRWTYRGIPIIPLGWDTHLDADFPHASSQLYAYPHRVIYTALNNLVIGIDAMNDFNKTDMWFNKDEEENRFRTKLIKGVNYIHNELMAVAY